MSLASRIAKGSFYQTGNTVYRGLLTFLITPYIIHSLGNRSYGFWVMVLSIFGAYELFDFGISSAVGRFLARSLGRDDPEEMNGIVNTSLAIFLVFAGVVALLTLGAAFSLGAFVQNPEEVGVFRVVLLILGLGLAANLPLKIFQGVLVSHIRYDQLSLIAIVRATVANLCMFLALRQGYGILALAWIHVLSRLGEQISVIVCARRAFPAMALGPRHVRRAVTRELFLYGGKAFVSQIADILRHRIDAFVIASFLAIDKVAIYDIGLRLQAYAGEIIQSALNVMVPVFSRYEGQRDTVNIREKFLLLTRFSIVISLFAGVSLILYGRAVITRWVGGGFDASYAILAVLAVAMIVEQIQNPAIQLLYGLSKHQFYAYINIAEGIANLALSIVLVRSFGLIGVALGTAIEIVFFKTLVLPVIVCRLVDVPLRRYYWRVLFGTAVRLLPPLGLFGLLAYPYITPDYGRIAALAALQVLLFAPVVYYFVLGPSERLFLASIRRSRESGQ